MASAAARFVTGGIILSVLLAVGGCFGASVKDQKEAQAHFKLGMSSLNRGELQPAKVEFEKSVEQNPKDRDAHYALGHIYYLWGKLDDAEREFQKVLAIDTQFPAARNYLGKVYEQRRDWPKAASEYRKALQDPKYETPQYAHFNLGIVLKNQDRLDEALLEFQDALRIDPNFGVAGVAASYSVFNELGQLYARLQRIPEAVDAYQKSLSLAPDYADAHYNLGLVYFKDGARGKAKEEFEKVIRLAPSAELAKNSRQYLDQLK